MVMGLLGGSGLGSFDLGGDIGGLLAGNQLADAAGIPTLGEAISGFTGQTGAEAALEGAALQAALGERGISVGEEVQLRLEETLSPFVGFGTDLLGRGSSLFGAGAGESITSDPVFTALADEAQRRIINRQAASGRLETGETPELLQDALLRTGADLLSRERSDILNAIGLGQSSAAQTGFAGAESARGTQDLLTQIGNVQAAGGIGAAQSLGQGSQNIAGLVGTVASLFSDRRLKRNISKHGKYKDYNTYKYQYAWSDDWYIGVMSDEVKQINPDAVITHESGYDMVNYGAL